MQLLGKQEELIDALQNKLSLISSRIQKITIQNENYQLCIEIEMELMYNRENPKIALKFIDVQEYSFYYRWQRIFYNVEILKFFKYDNLFYISFDPVDESLSIAGEDQDFIKAKLVEGYLL